MFSQTKISKSIVAAAMLLMPALAIFYTVPATDRIYAIEPCQGALQGYQDGADETETPECDPNAPPYETKQCPDGSTQHIDALCPQDPSAIASNICGADKTVMYTSIDFGCTGEGNGIVDLSLAILRQLWNAVGIVLIGVTMWAGVQYGASRGDPNMVTGAKKRLFNVLISLVLYIFSYPIISFIAPGLLL